MGGDEESLVFLRVVEQVAVPVVHGTTTGHVGGTTGQCAVGVQLHASEAQSLVAQMRGQAQCSQVAKVAGQHHQGRPQPEAAVVTCPQPVVHLPFGNLAVAHRGDAGTHDESLAEVEHPVEDLR